MADDWTTGDTVRQAAVTALLIADCAQTRWTVHHPVMTTTNGQRIDTYETNRFLGNHPTTGQVNAYFAAEIVFHATVSYFLPSEWRKGWQYVWIGYEGDAVIKNYRMGVRMDF